MATKNMQSPNGGGTIGTMPQSLARVVLHIAFSTKNRGPFLKEVDLRARLHAYMARVLQNIGCAGSTGWRLTNDMCGIEACAQLTRCRDLLRPVGAWENV